jgi:hypothetical protein
VKIVRFSHEESIRYGIVDGTDLVVLEGDPMFAGFGTTGERVPLGEVSLLAPVIPRSTPPRWAARLRPNPCFS